MDFRPLYECSLDDEEAVALAIGLRTAAQGGVAGIEESSIRALAKLAQVMPPRLRRRIDALHATKTVRPSADGWAQVGEQVFAGTFGASSPWPTMS